MIIRELLRYLLEYDSNEEIFIRTPSGEIEPTIVCRAHRNLQHEIIGFIIGGEHEYAMTQRCEITTNPCGSDTWEVNHPCQCPPCKKWLAGFAQNELREAIDEHHKIILPGSDFPNGRTPKIL